MLSVIHKHSTGAEGGKKLEKKQRRAARDGADGRGSTEREREERGERETEKEDGTVCIGFRITKGERGSRARHARFPPWTQPRSRKESPGTASGYFLAAYFPRPGAEVAPASNEQ